jgi:hypothetical protein
MSVCIKGRNGKGLCGYCLSWKLLYPLPPPHIPETTLSKVTLTDCENITLALECVTWLNVHMFSQIWLESRQNSINALFLGVYFLRLGHGDYNG